MLGMLVSAFVGFVDGVHVCTVCLEVGVLMVFVFFAGT